MIEAIKSAYQAPHLTGSPFTLPSRTCYSFFSSKALESSNGWEKVAWQVAHIITGIFIYPLASLPSLIGTVINLLYKSKPVNPSNHLRNAPYTFWQKIWGANKTLAILENPISKHLETLRILATLKTRIYVGGCSYSSNDRSYKKQQALSFIIYKNFSKENENLMFNTIDLFCRQYCIKLDCYDFNAIVISEPAKLNGNMSEAICRLDIFIPDSLQLKNDPESPFCITSAAQPLLT